MDTNLQSIASRSHQAATIQYCIELCTRCSMVTAHAALSHCPPGEVAAALRERCMFLTSAAEITRLTARYLSEGLPFGQEACTFCAKVCEACADRCMNITSLQECYVACMACAAQCRLVAV